MPGAESRTYRRGMAEEIRRRLAGLRLAAALAVALTIAGFTTRDTLTTVNPTATSTLPANSVGSSQIIDGAVRLADIFPGTVLTPSQASSLYLKIADAADQYVKMSPFLTIKQQVADLYTWRTQTVMPYFKGLFTFKHDINDWKSQTVDPTLAGLNTWKSEVTQEITDIKGIIVKHQATLDGLDTRFVQGHGSVLTGIIGPDQPLLDLGTATIDANSAQEGQVTLTNKSGGDLLLSFGGKSVTLPDGQSQGILIGLNQPSIVQVNGDGKSLTTITLNRMGDGSVFTAQAIVGAP